MKTRDAVVIAILIYLLWPPRGDATVTIGPGTPLPPTPAPPGTTGSASAGNGSTSGSDGSGVSDPGTFNSGGSDPGVYPDGNPVWDESGNVYQPMSDGSRVYLGNVFDGPVCGYDQNGQSWCVEYVVTESGSSVTVTCPAGTTMTNSYGPVCSVDSPG